jgi:hypothetical protein
MKTEKQSYTSPEQHLITFLITRNSVTNNKINSNKIYNKLPSDFINGTMDEKYS